MRCYTLQDDGKVKAGIDPRQLPIKGPSCLFPDGPILRAGIDFEPLEGVSLEGWLLSDPYYFGYGMSWVVPERGSEKPPYAGCALVLGSLNIYRPDRKLGDRSAVFHLAETNAVWLCPMGMTRIVSNAYGLYRNSGGTVEHVEERKKEFAKAARSHKGKRSSELQLALI